MTGDEAGFVGTETARGMRGLTPWRYCTSGSTKMVCESIDDTQSLAASLFWSQ